MSEEPRRVVEGLVRAREALEAASPPPPVGLLDDDDEREFSRIRTHGVVELRQARWATMCPQRFYNAALDWIEAQHGAAQAAELREWGALAPRPNLVLLGPVGTGKTGAAIAACRDDWFERGVDLLFLPLIELLDELRPGGDDQAFDRLVFAERLIVDDLGTERPTDWTRERVEAVINRRWLEERPTIVTSNLTPDALRDTVGDRVFSRLVGGDAYVVTLGGPDRRRSR